MKLKAKIYKTGSCLVLLFSSLLAQDGATDPAACVHSIHFNEVPMSEFVKFVSKVCNLNFVFDHKDLQFNVTLTSGKSLNEESLLRALKQMLQVRGLTTTEEDGSYLIYRAEEKASASKEKAPPTPQRIQHSSSGSDFLVYKLQYHQGSEIQDAIKKVAIDMQHQPEASQQLIAAIQTVQWIKATNSILCSGDPKTLLRLKKLISSLDIPLKQVFIEVLVIETDARNGSEFGLQWSGGAQFSNRVGFGAGDLSRSGGHVPIGGGFDFGVIGDLILHRGKCFLTLSSLVSALQSDSESTIVLNQKLITQDSKNSKIFVGDNIPFTGSVVQTIGQSQQTTSNIEYRDIGVNLSITPMLGDDDIISLDIEEEISESLNDSNGAWDRNSVNGIRTTKTNMVTHVHVPDQHFLVLSGMIRNARSQKKTGLPCLGGLPWIGAAFSKTHKQNEKRNIIVFVRPHIIRSFEDYKQLTQQEALKTPAEAILLEKESASD